MMPALLFNPHTGGRVIQFVLFWALAALAGKKNNPLATILTILGITVFNLLVPYGEVLFSLGVFRVTSGALLAGLRRAATLEGLFMLSRLTVRPDLHLPGSFGGLIGESFRILTLITEKKHRVRAKSLAADIDELMLELSAPDAAPGETESPTVPSTVPGIIILAAAVIAAWLPWLFLRGEVRIP
jgi:heptaprenyl diphosphate synthase